MPGATADNGDIPCFGQLLHVSRRVILDLALTWGFLVPVSSVRRDEARRMEVQYRALVRGRPVSNLHCSSHCGGLGSPREINSYEAPFLTTSDYNQRTLYHMPTCFEVLFYSFTQKRHLSVPFLVVGPSIFFIFDAGPHAGGRHS